MAIVEHDGGGNRRRDMRGDLHDERMVRNPRAWLSGALLVGFVGMVGAFINYELSEDRHPRSRHESALNVGSVPTSGAKRLGISTTSVTLEMATPDTLPPPTSTTIFVRRTLAPKRPPTTSRIPTLPSGNAATPDRPGDTRPVTSAPPDSLIPPVGTLPLAAEVPTTLPPDTTPGTGLGIARGTVIPPAEAAGRLEPTTTTTTLLRPTTQALGATSSTLPPVFVP